MVRFKYLISAVLLTIILLVLAISGEGVTNQSTSIASIVQPVEKI